MEMKKEYVTPEIEVLEVEVEQGFAGSPGGGGQQEPGYPTGDV